MSIIVSDFSSLMPYLNGSKFDENMHIKYEKEGIVSYRGDLLKSLCSGKRVLHVGCTDHVPLIRSKIDKRDWLHGLITEVSNFTLGVDIDAHAVQEASKISGLTNMVPGDITADEKIEQITKDYFDIALFGEVVEHISNPVDFLRRFLIIIEKTSRK